MKKDNSLIEQKIEELLQEKINNNDVLSIFNRNDFFSKRIIKDFNQHILFPALKQSFSELQLNVLIKTIKEKKQKFEDDKITVEDYIEDLSFNYLKFLYDAARSVSIILKNDYSLDIPRYDIQGIIVCGIYYYIFNDVSKSLKQIFSTQVSDIYYSLYELTNIPEPQIPRLNKSFSILKTNIDTINESWNINLEVNRENIKNIDWINNYLIGKEIGSGAYGKVFSLRGSDWVVKIALGGVDFGKDLRRFKEIERQLYSGKASVEDMHYFEHGLLGTFGSKKREVYYIVMPKIIPFNKTVEYKNNEDSFRSIVGAAYSISGRYFDGYVATSQKEYDQTIKEALNKTIEYLKKQYPNALQEVSVDRISSFVKAFARARSIHWGSDLHMGNIGYLEQNPKVLFFYDM